MKTYRKDHVGEKYGRLTILGDAEPHISPNGSKSRQVLCKCSCGTFIFTHLHSVRAGVATSCGCFAKEESSRRNRTHGMSHSPTYEAWHAMLKRGRGTSDRENYYLRGIRVCDRWLESFENFLEDMGERPDGLSIDRINNDGDYEKNNCRWADNKTQSRNQRKTLYVEFESQKFSLSELTERFGVPHTVARGRLRLGWTIEQILNTPVAKQSPKKRNTK